MPKITVQAWACKFVHRPTGRATQIELGVGPLVQHTVEVRTVRDVADAMDAALQEASQTHAGSIQVSQRLIEGRAPAGYRHMVHRAELDRDAA